jgi:CheY-like chemotaxis protein
MRLLHAWIIEDNAPDAFLMDLALRKTNLPLQCTTIADGELALQNIEWCAEGRVPPPALLLLDLHLPRISGGEILKAVSASPKLSETRLALFSSLPALQNGIQLRINDRYIRKSLHLDEFLNQIITWVKESIPDDEDGNSS